MSIWNTASKIALGGILILGVIGWHTFDKKMAVKAANQASEVLYASRLALSVIHAKEVETSLLNSALQSSREKNEIINKLNTSLSTALSELQQRPKRSTSNSSTPANRNTCTGSELYREDAEFLTREAYRAEQLIIERDFYYEQYERAREALAAYKRAAPR